MDAVTFAAKLSMFARLLRVGSACGVDCSDQVKDGLRELIGVAPLNTVSVPDGIGYKYVPCMTPTEVDTARFKGKLDAIKMYKDRTKLSLMDSKRAVEVYIDTLGYTFHKY